MRRWNDRIFRKRLGRIAVLFCLVVLLAGCSGSACEKSGRSIVSYGGYGNGRFPEAGPRPGTGTRARTRAGTGT